MRSVPLSRVLICETLRQRLGIAPRAIMESGDTALRISEFRFHERVASSPYVAITQYTPIGERLMYEISFFIVLIGQKHMTGAILDS